MVISSQIYLVRMHTDRKPPKDAVVLTIGENMKKLSFV